MRTEPNESAFPVTQGQDFAPREWGLTKREYFASMFMQALISQYENKKDKGYFLFDINNIIPHAAIIYADQLIEELNKDNK